MDREHFISIAPMFEPCGIVTISGKDFDEVNQLACDARDAIIADGKAALVFDVDTTVGFIRSAMMARFSSVWKSDTRFFKGQTVVPPYVVRPVPGATVSTPLEWDELEGELHPSMFTIRTVPERLQRRGDLFRAALDDPQDLLPAIEALAEHLKR